CWNPASHVNCRLFGIATRTWVFCRGGTPWPPLSFELRRLGRPRSAAPTKDPRAFSVAVYIIDRCIVSIHIQHLFHKTGGCAIFSRPMQGSSRIFEPQETTPAIKLDGAEIRLIRLPLLEPFETSFGKIDSRLIFLLCLQADGLRGWGEVVAEEEPRYSYETVRTAFHVIKDFFGPAVLADPIRGLDDLAQRLAPFRGHNMAKAGLELAFMDLLGQVKQQSLSTLLGGELKRVAVGVSLGIQPTLSKLLQRVDRYLDLGYQRIKLKIKPGWDIDV